jgi:VanZ family protein
VKAMRRWLRALLPLVAYAGLIYAVSAQSSFAVRLPRFPHADKVVHATEYAGFGFLAARAVTILVPRGPVFAAGVAIVVGACYGATDELHQRFVPRRDADPWDLVADIVGSALGAGAYLAFSLARNRRRRNQLAGESP